VTNNEIDRVLDQCRTEIRVIKACDEVLGIKTPTPAKPRSEREARRVLRDLRYLSWLLEGLRKDLLDGQVYERNERARMDACEKAKANVAAAA
jgi:predicted house-cleaning NTP pyrophosphatase (Maf/HAM1 superfamily)